MGPWLVLVSPCFRENVVASCKSVSFLYSIANLLQKNAFFFWNQISKWRSFEKRAVFDLLFTFLVTREKLQKFLQHTSHLHTNTYFAHPIDFFCLTNFGKRKRIYQVWFLFGMSPGVDSYSRHFWNNQWITKWWAKFKLECLLLICTYTNAKFIDICKPRTLSDGGETQLNTEIAKSTSS